VWISEPGLHAEMQGIWPLAELDPRMFRYFPVWDWLELFGYEHGVVVIHKVRFRIAEDVAEMKVRRVHVNPHLFPNLSHDGFLSAPSLAFLALANTLRRLFPINDDSDVASFASPSVTLLGGSLSQILSDSHLSPLWGLRVSRYPRGYAVTSTPEGPELPRYGAEVIKEPRFFVPLPYGL
jgi:hypothetical protein